MKTLQTIGKSLVAVSILFLASCSSDDAPATNVPVLPPANTSYVKAKVDGAAFTTLIFGTSTASCSWAGTGADKIITILGGDMAANSITVHLQGINAVGTYSVNDSTDSLLNYSPGSGGFAYSTASCSSASGTIQITAISETAVEGTFSFVGKDSENCAGTGKTVTEGKFKGVKS